jgi:hypothetical protein
VPLLPQNGLICQGNPLAAGLLRFCGIVTLVPVAVMLWLRLSDPQVRANQGLSLISACEAEMVGQLPTFTP